MRLQINIYIYNYYHSSDMIRSAGLRQLDKIRMTKSNETRSVEFHLGSGPANDYLSGTSYQVTVIMINVLYIYIYYYIFIIHIYFDIHFSTLLKVQPVIRHTK